MPTRAMTSPMVIFLAGAEPDYLSAMLFRGFVEFLGANRVFDVAPSYYLHFDDDSNSSRLCRNITCEEIGRCDGLIGLLRNGELDPRILANETDRIVFVLHNSHLRDTAGSWVRAQEIYESLPQSAKVVYIIGDDHCGPYAMVPFMVSVVFQREIDPQRPEAITSQPLPFGCLPSWLPDVPSTDRPIDVFYAGSPTDSNRCSMPHKMARLADAGLSVVCGTGKGMPRSVYMEMLRHSKMAICPTGGGNCSDTLRNWEAIAAGALPIFPSHPNRVRGGFGLESVLDFHSMTWENLVERLTHMRHSVDWTRVVRELSCLARVNTTTERARRVLQYVGYDLADGSV